jgi:hypothetical protein
MCWNISQNCCTVEKLATGFSLSMKDYDGSVYVVGCSFKIQRVKLERSAGSSIF